MSKTVHDDLGVLEEVYAKSGLDKLLEKDWNEIRSMGREFAKFQFKPNDWRIASMEIWRTESGPYFRIHYSETAKPLLRSAICSLPGGQLRQSENRVKADFDGDPMVIAANLAGALALARAGASL